MNQTPGMSAENVSEVAAKHNHQQRQEGWKISVDEICRELNTTCPNGHSVFMTSCTSFICLNVLNRASELHNHNSSNEENVMRAVNDPLSPSIESDDVSIIKSFFVSKSNS